MKVTNLITPDVLAGIDDINRKCHAMHLPSPPVQFFNAEVRNSSGELVEVLKSKSNSWVRNAYNLLAQYFLPCDSFQGSSTFGAGSMAFKDTGGTARRSSGYTGGLNYGNYPGLYNSSANADFGILVGTSADAETFESHTLVAKVAHGTSAGQLSYSAGAAPSATYNAETKKWTGTLARVFTNNSGGDVVVREIGLCYELVVASAYKLLISRDVLATPITVANGQTLTITYTSEITYPA